MGLRVLRDNHSQVALAQPSKCILCGASESKLLFSKEGYQIVKCVQCDLVYTFQQDFSPLESIYNEEYYRSQDPFFGYLDYEAYEHLFKKTFARRLAEIEKRTAKGPLLDVGCALGFFLQTAQESGWEACGVEVSPYAARYAKSRGLHVVEGTVEEAEFPRGFFRVVTVWDLFEGLADPFSTLTTIRDLLGADGMLVIGTPNAESLVSQLLGGNWAHFKPKENRFYFSPRTIRAMLKKSGFIVRAISSREGGQFCDLRFISEKVYPLSAPLGRALRFLSRSHLLVQLSFYLNTRDRMVIYASKEEKGIDES